MLKYMIYKTLEWANFIYVYLLLNTKKKPHSVKSRALICWYRKTDLNRHARRQRILKEQCFHLPFIFQSHHVKISHLCTLFANENTK